MEELLEELPALEKLHLAETSHEMSLQASFASRQLSGVFYKLAKQPGGGARLGPARSKLIGAAKAMLEQGLLEPTAGSMIITSLVRLSKVDKQLVAGLLPDLLILVTDRDSRLSAADAARLLWSSVKLHSPELDEMPFLVAPVLRKHMGDLTPTDLSKVLWATARVRSPPNTLLKVLASIAQDRALQRLVRRMTGHDVANALWAVAQLQDRVPELFALVPLLVVRLGQVPIAPVGVSSLMQSVALLKDSCQDALARVPQLAAAIRGAAARMTGGHCAVTLWAIAKLAPNAPELCTALPFLAPRAIETVEEVSVNQATTMLWAVANLRAADPDLDSTLPAIARAIESKAEQLEDRDLAMLFIATKWLKDDSPELVRVVSDFALAKGRRISKLVSPNDFANIIEATVQIQDVAPELKHVAPLMMEALEEQSAYMNIEALVKVLVAAAALKEGWEPMLATLPTVVEALSLKVSEAKVRHVIRIIMVSAQLRDKAPLVVSLVSLVVGPLQEHLANLELSTVSDVAWATSLLREDSPELEALLPQAVEMLRDHIKELPSNRLVRLLGASAVLDQSPLIELLPELASAFSQRDPWKFADSEKTISWAAERLSQQGHRSQELLDLAHELERGPPPGEADGSYGGYDDEDTAGGYRGRAGSDDWSFEDDDEEYWDY